MVVFGFAFNQGSFQAVSSVQHTLKDFTLPAAPADSMDATLAPSGIPLFSLDLRAAPKEGPVAEWLHAAHATRSIGAMYPDNSPYASMSDLLAPQAFDAVLFVEKTSAALKNGGVPGSAGQMVEFRAVAQPAGDTSGATEYRDPDFAVSLRLPKGWKMEGASRWSDHETTVQLIDGTSRAGALYFKMMPNAERPEKEAYTRLLAEPEAKAAQRVAAGVAEYRIRPDSVERRTVGGRPALSCVGEFTQGNVKMAEYLVWVSGENA